MRIESIVLVSSLLIAAGCDKEIGRTVGDSQISTEEVTCQYTAPGYCMDCGISFDGKYDCSLRFKPYCSHSGRQMADVFRSPVVVKYQSGKERAFIEKRIIKTHSECAG